jgi:hypothetical protein
MFEVLILLLRLWSFGDVTPCTLQIGTEDSEDCAASVINVEVKIKAEYSSIILVLLC